MRIAPPCRLPAAALAFAVAASVAAPARGQATENGPGPSFAHLRPIDALARELLDEGWNGSETMRALVAALEGSDVFVQIETRAQETTRGILRFASGSPVCRWVRVTVRIPARRPILVAALAHELQHAVEVAEAPDARDRESVEALFRRIGFRRDGPQFETEAALAVEERVLRELAQSNVGG